MSFKTYEQGLRQASEQANKAIQIESSISNLSPLVSALPTLQKAFPAYISAAEVYSHLLSSNLVPSDDIANVRKKWRLVLERAEKIKARIESLGGQVGKVGIGDEGEEVAVLRRGSKVNGVEIPLWNGEPSQREFGGDRYVDGRQPELADEQIHLDPIWREVPLDTWTIESDQWILKQGPVSDCSVVAAMGVNLEHDRQFGSSAKPNNLYPQDDHGRARRSDNGKHVLKLLLNGAWRKVVFDALLPHTPNKNPLYTTCHPLYPSVPASSSGVPWVPLALKGYFKVFGGYSLKGSNPAPDIYAYTGWIPERLSFRDGFQREKEWSRIYTRWKNGEVMLSLGTGDQVSEGLVRLHAYGVVALREEETERFVDVFDPGSTTFTLSWDRICSEFEALHLNWKPTLMPTIATRHWSWPKPKSSSSADMPVSANPQYHLNIANASEHQELWLLLSQHITSKDRPLDDIALHVFEEYGHGTTGRIVRPEMADQTSPYSNDMHVLVRYPLRRSASSLVVIAARDRGNYQTGFTLNAYAPAGTTLSLERVSQTLPFSQVVSGTLNSRNAGGHPGHPTHLLNPQYKVTLQNSQRGGKVDGRLILQGEKERAWNVKLLWGKGDLVNDISEDMVVADTGAYSHGMAYCDIPQIDAGTYTLIVSSYEPNHTGSYMLSVESTSPVCVTSIPAEGAGMYSRVVHGAWNEKNAGGRPSSGRYESNPKIEMILPAPGTILSRLFLPNPSVIPINLTIFRRGPGGNLGEQVSTSGPYIDTVSGVSTGKVKLDKGIYLLVPSSFEAVRTRWTVKVWSDITIAVESVT
ncbi:uncharacterized protein I303_102634 [Kwoniella dejecticola CBS 10117]|uniref:Calpain catalytic domain-containing protein n=1 Tax=Kwoniella dejecticola CBS 10117 TaxID=1296121 RepID=A0A1A6A9A7_9TREE|nr:uncharacterized protein I303_02648 [Kwoniella dejecticola CBS 10117]OBR86639.1 hypothetical protein I303_02648 [Kwoniella dejecticola CBS 10117]